MLLETVRGRAWPLVCLVVVLILAAVMATAGEVDKGKAEITLYGGKSGEVWFPHHQHQKAMQADCHTCHELYDQQSGIIDTMKSDGRLKKKQVMNKQCTKCHRQKKRAGVKTGPTSCKTCHTKASK